MTSQPAPPEPRDRILGCLLGGALGDALGAPLEFMRLADIRQSFGPDGLRHLAPAYGRRGAITDDTQMTLFTAEGLVEAWDRGSARGVQDFVGTVHLAYLRWLKTQGETSAHPAFDPTASRGLAGIPDLNARRAPGQTCLSALKSTSLGSRRAPLNDSRGCGGLMRIAPVGLAFAEAFDLGCDIAALTHGEPGGYLAAGCFAQIIADVCRGADLRAAIAHAQDLLAAEPGHGRTLGAIQSAVALSAAGDPSAARLETLGEGWVAEEALAIALYCALVARDWVDGVVLAANHSGDSDSTGSLTGNLLGALWGQQALPPGWLVDLELREVIADLAQALYDRYWQGPETSPLKGAGEE